MLSTVWSSLRLGFSVGVSSGALVGLIAGLGGSMFTNTLPNLATFAVGVFWLLLLALPLVYARNVMVAGRLVLVTLIAWLPAYLSAVVAFMIPVVIVPVVLNRGVSFGTSAGWYDQVYTRLLNGPVVPVGIATAIGFAAVAYLLHQRKPVESA